MLEEGPDEDNWRALAKELKIENNVDWVAQVPHSEVEDIYQGHDIFLFPSLHDSAGMVVLEATTNGLPVICIDTGGPGLIVNKECGVKVDASNCGEPEASNQLATAILNLCGDPIQLAERSRSVQNWAKSQTWGSKVSSTLSKLGAPSEKTRAQSRGVSPGAL